MLPSRRTVRAGGVLLTAAVVAELGLIYLGQTYGSIPEERRQPLPGDYIVPNPTGGDQPRHDHRRTSGSRLAMVCADGLASGWLVSY
jgi:hypothetical protein